MSFEIKSFASVKLKSDLASVSSSHCFKETIALLIGSGFTIKLKVLITKQLEAFVKRT